MKLTRDQLPLFSPHQTPAIQETSTLTIQLTAKSADALEYIISGCGGIVDTIE